MYPTRDFRTLLNATNEAECPLDVVRSVAREPLLELLRYWEETGKPETKYTVYAEGITKGVANNRWPSYTLSYIKEYPEFYQPLLSGLEQAWLNLEFRLCLSDGLGQTETKDRLSLCVDFGSGQLVQMSPEDKIRLLNWLRVKMTIPLRINGESHRVGIFTSREATEIYQRIFWLEAILENGSENPLVANSLS